MPTFHHLILGLCLVSACLGLQLSPRPRSFTRLGHFGREASTMTSLASSSSSTSSSSSSEEALRAFDNLSNDEGELLSGWRGGRPLKVAIAGGGVGGLTTALAMLKRGMDVTVYERTEAFARFGGPIQFASNALSVIKAIDGDLFNQIMARFTFTGTRSCGIKDGLRAKGFKMTEDSLDYVVNADAPPDWFVKFPLKQCADVFGLPYTGVIDRPDLQEILIAECKKIKPDFIKNGRGVVGYESRGPGGGVSVKFAGGGGGGGGGRPAGRERRHMERRKGADVRRGGQEEHAQQDDEAGLHVQRIHRLRRRDNAEHGGLL